MKLKDVKNELKKKGIEYIVDEMYNFEYDEGYKGLNVFGEVVIVVNKRALDDLVKNDECIKRCGDGIGLVLLDGSGYMMFDDINEVIEEVKKHE